MQEGESVSFAVDDQYLVGCRESFNGLAFPPFQRGNALLGRSSSPRPIGKLPRKGGELPIGIYAVIH